MDFERCKLTLTFGVVAMMVLVWTIDLDLSGMWTWTGSNVNDRFVILCLTHPKYLLNNTHSIRIVWSVYICVYILYIRVSHVDPNCERKEIGGKFQANCLVRELKASKLSRAWATFISLGLCELLRINCCWSSPAQSFLVPESTVLVDICFSLTILGVGQLPPVSGNSTVWHSSKLLLVLSLHFEPRGHPWPNLCSSWSAVLFRVFCFLCGSNGEHPQIL
jgi:hypothetical protein